MDMFMIKVCLTITLLGSAACSVEDEGIGLRENKIDTFLGDSSRFDGMANEDDAVPSRNPLLIQMLKSFAEDRASHMIKKTAPTDETEKRDETKMNQSKLNVMFIRSDKQSDDKNTPFIPDKAEDLNLSSSDPDNYTDPKSIDPIGVKNIIKMVDESDSMIHKNVLTDTAPVISDGLAMNAKRIGKEIRKNVMGDEEVIDDNDSLDDKRKYRKDGPENGMTVDYLTAFVKLFGERVFRDFMEKNYNRRPTNKGTRVPTIPYKNEGSDKDSLYYYEDYPTTKKPAVRMDSFFSYDKMDDAVDVPRKYNLARMRPPTNKFDIKLPFETFPKNSKKTPDIVYTYYDNSPADFDRDFFDNNVNVADRTSFRNKYPDSMGGYIKSPSYIDRAILPNDYPLPIFKPKSAINPQFQPRPTTGGNRRIPYSLFSSFHDPPIFKPSAHPESIIYYDDDYDDMPNDIGYQQPMPVPYHSNIYRAPDYLINHISDMITIEQKPKWDLRRDDVTSYARKKTKKTVNRRLDGRPASIKQIYPLPAQGSTRSKKLLNRNTIFLDREGNFMNEYLSDEEKNFLEKFFKQ
ncbi:unnamed protein product [Gordionus sp. m RMFG-2023]|uniref:uncharacterized protein LOC135922746 n=1 Tax=Gordionus sp. m RMFG-2023 TaxID=3053472 RepID=UPI0030E4CAEC